MKKVVVTDYEFEDLDVEAAIVKQHGCELIAPRRKNDAQQLIELCSDADAIISQYAPLTPAVIAKMKKVGAIVRYGIGVDNVDLPAAKEHGIPVCNIPDYCIDEVADHTLALLLAVTRQIVSGTNYIRSGKWGLAGPFSSMVTLSQLTVGQVGLGRIGRAVVHRLKGFGCKISAYDPALDASDIRGLGCHPATLDEVLEKSDIVTLHIPSTAQTKKMINAERLAKFKKGAILLNVSRGTLVDTDALVAALKSGQLSGAGLDVSDPEPIPDGHPLRSLDNVAFTSHVAACSAKAIHRLRSDVATIASLGSHRQAGNEHRQRRAEQAISTGTASEARSLPRILVESVMAKNWMMDHSAGAIRVKIDDLTRFVVDVLTSLGMSREHAETTADVLVSTDARGVSSHGVKSLRGYVRRLRGGGLKVNAQPHVVKEGPSWAGVDGDNAIGMVTSTFAMRQAMEKARGKGIGLAVLRESCHFGAAGHYAAMAAAEGFIALAMANDIPSVIAPGSRGAITGTNPLAYAVPTSSGDPIMLDVASSVVAGGKVMAHHYHGKPIPETWVVDNEGRPTTDPAKFFAGGALQPFAGHKGYGIALLIEMLAGALSGAGLTWQIKAWIEADPSVPTNHGGCFIAIDVSALMPLEEFKARVDHVADQIRSAPKAAGSDRIYLPGDIEADNRRRARTEGIILPAEVVAPSPAWPAIWASTSPASCRTR